MNATVRKLIHTHRPWLVGVIYSIILGGSLFLAYWIQSDLSTAFVGNSNFLGALLWVIPLKLGLLYLFQQFSGGLSFFSIPDLKRLVYSLGSGFLLLTILGNLEPGYPVPQSGIVLADFSFSLLGLAGVRLAFRCSRERWLVPSHGGGLAMTRVGIIGAGDAGAGLARELANKPGLGLHPVAFFDDDPAKWRFRVHGVPVYGAPEILLRNEALRKKLDHLVIAMPSASSSRVRELVNTLQKTGLKLETVPSLDQLATGWVKVTHLRPVEIEDLLGRDPVQLELEHIRELLRGRRVMVTGAGGSIGSELCRQIADYQPSELILVEQCEVQMFIVHQELTAKERSLPIVPMVADVFDGSRMRQLFHSHRPEVIFHAAAHKHVPIMEAQPGEAVKNNALATAQLADLAIEYGVDRFVLISTDKAINPTSVMGATKRLAEMYIQALQGERSGATQFMAVRFGNVLGSSGSVVPIFKQQIAAGGPVRITHPEITRYFMTIPEAVGLVLQSAAQGQGGEIFVLDMGEPIKIVDLARQLIRLSGLRPDDDIPIEFTGLRPGEKLFEEIQCDGENMISTDHPKILRLVTQAPDLAELRGGLQKLMNRLDQEEPETIKGRIRRLVPEYQPWGVGPADEKPSLEGESQAPLREAQVNGDKKAFPHHKPFVERPLGAVQ